MLKPMMAKLAAGKFSHRSVPKFLFGSGSLSACRVQGNSYHIQAQKLWCMSCILLSKGEGVGGCLALKHFELSPCLTLFFYKSSRYELNQTNQPKTKPKNCNNPPPHTKKPQRTPQKPHLKKKDKKKQVIIWTREIYWKSKNWLSFE